MANAAVRGGAPGTVDQSRVDEPALVDGHLTPPAWAVVIPLAVAKVAFQLVTSDLYGAHRDEFYYLASGHHPAWGYVDNPPLVPMLYRFEEAAFGHSVTALAVVPGLLGGVYVVLGALLAREVGGGRFAQSLAGVVALLGSIFLTPSHFLSTVSLDLLFWAVGSLLVLRMIRTGDRRLWVPIGVVCGLGLLSKYTMGFWVLATVLGLLATPQRKLLATYWLLAGAAIAAALVAPSVAWEVTNHWPTLAFLRNLKAANAHHNLVQFVPLQPVMATIGGTVVWVTALAALARRPEWRRQRWLLVGYVVVVVVLVALAGKAYYLGSWYLPLVAVGSVTIEQRWRRSTRIIAMGLVVVSGLALAPFATPVLPKATAVRLHLDTANSDLGGMLGWPSVVATVAETVHGLPEGQQQKVVILANDYAEAGAVDFYGPSLGLPDAISGHNSFWLWGYGHPAPGATVVAIGLSAAFVHRYWASVTRAATLGSGSTAIDPQERGAVIWVCRGQRVSWATLWPRTRHYD